MNDMIKSVVALTGLCMGGAFLSAVTNASVHKPEPEPVIIESPHPAATSIPSVSPLVATKDSTQDSLKKTSIVLKDSTGGTKK
jgi:hypothetical protein